MKTWETQYQANAAVAVRRNGDSIGFLGRKVGSNATRTTARLSTIVSYLENCKQLFFGWAYPTPDSVYSKCRETSSASEKVRSCAKSAEKAALILT